LLDGKAGWFELRNGLAALLEMKGAEFEMDHAKHQTARRWVSAVNNWGRLAKWDFKVCRDPLALGMLSRPS
jgi:type III restriction enzyme